MVPKRSSLGNWRCGILNSSDFFQDGKVVVWRCDVRGRLTSLCQYRLKSPASHCVFRNLKSTYDTRTNDSPLFFLASENGSVNYADDSGHCSEDIKVETNIQAMLMLDSTDTLVIVTQDLVLSQYTVTSGKFSKTIEVCYPLSLFFISSN